MDTAAILDQIRREQIQRIPICPHCGQSASFHKVDDSMECHECHKWFLVRAVTGYVTEKIGSK